MSAKNVVPFSKKPILEFKASLEFALDEDEKDPLRSFKEEFHFPFFEEASKKIQNSFPHQKSCLYFAGHSLGLQPKKTKNFLEAELQAWKDLAVEGHFCEKMASGEDRKAPWLSYDTLLEASLAQLLGAKEEEICLMNSLTVNLHLMMVSFYRPNKKRHKILLLREEFPSDRYAIMSQISFRGLSLSSSLLLLSPRPQENCVREEDVMHVLETQGEEMALIFIGNPNYLTGQVFDTKEIIKLGHEKGCLVGLDLAHAVGNLNLNLHEEGPDFAVWCSYKYLNGGPGSVGGCFIHERHLQDERIPRFSGWWGHEDSTRFQMPFDFQPIKNAKAWKLSNPSIFQMAPLVASMNLFHQVGQKSLRNKGEKLTSFLEFLLKHELSDSVQVLTPSPLHQRGSQLSLMFPKVNKREFHSSSEIQKELRKKGVFSDARGQHILRVTPCPFYCGFQDVYFFVQALKETISHL